MSFVQLLRGRFGWLDKLLSKGETYTSLWQQYGESLKPVVRAGMALVLGSWTALGGSWLPVGIGVAVVVFAALSMAANSRRMALAVRAPVPAVAPISAALPSENDGRLDDLSQQQRDLAARFDAFQQAIVTQINARHEVATEGLRREIAEAKAYAEERSGAAHGHILVLRKEILDLLRARDDQSRLQSLDAKATELFDKLFFAKEHDYSNEDAWRAEYLNWKSCIENYWAILRSYSESVSEPFALTEADFDGKNGIPGNALFARDAMRVLYQIMLVVNERHARLRDNASVFMAEKSRPPAR